MMGSEVMGGESGVGSRRSMSQPSSLRKRGSDVDSSVKYSCFGGIFYKGGGFFFEWGRMYLCISMTEVVGKGEREVGVGG